MEQTMEIKTDKREWKIVSRDGNPDREGEYIVVLIFPCYDENNVPGKAAIIDSRYFGDAEEFNGWIMKDQPNSGLVWTEETGSFDHETVYAWMEQEQLSFPELPEGCEPLCLRTKCVV